MATKAGDNKALTDRQRLFVAEYCRCLNATKAAIAAGYSEKSARQMGCDNLAVPKIRAAINAKLAGRRMSAEEVIARIEQHATGSMEYLLSNVQQTVQVGFGEEETVDSWELDLGKIQKLGLMHLIRKYKVDPKTGAITIELYDAQKALFQLGRAYHALGNDATSRNDEYDNDDITDEDIADELEKL